MINIAGNREVQDNDASENEALVRAYIEAVGQKQFEQVSNFLQPAVEFTLPGRTIQGVQAYISSLRKLGPILLRNDVKKIFVDGNDACVIYDFVTDTSVGAVPSVEWLTIEDGRIRSIRLIFHSKPWPAVLEELARRSA
jgi:hypothetical protein